jgi:hypothetical protein
VLEPAQVGVGETVELSVEVRGSQEATAPDIPHVDGLTIRYVGPATNVSIVNGQMTASITHHFTVVPSREGRFAFGPITVQAGGRQYSAGNVTLTVTGGGAAREDVRLVLSAPKAEVYLRERLPVTLKLYVGKVRVSDLQYPTVSGDGFLLDKFPEPVQRAEQTADGSFHVVEFTSTLTPLRSGPLTLGPATMSLNLVVRGRGGDPFFGHFGQRARPLQLQSAPLSLTILPLPDAGRPADFSGAVGRFELDVRAAPVDVAAGDPVTVTATVRGDGSLDGVAPPAIPEAGDALRVYPAQPASGTRPAGTWVFEQVVIPQRAGAMTLPEIRFSYFDPEARAYRTAARPGIALDVRPSPHAAPVPPAAAKPEAEVLGHDLVFIKDEPGRLRPVGARLHRSGLFWAAQAIPLLLWIGVAVYDRRRRRFAGDIRYARFSRAGRAARRELAAARTALRAADGPAFYDRVARAIRDYLSAKLDLPPGAITVDAVALRLAAAGLPTAAADDVEALFTTCEQARFAPPGDGRPDMERTLGRAEAIVRTLERTRRLGPSMAAAWLLLGIAAGVGAAGDTPRTIFFRGNTLYAEEHYPAAAAEYERIVAAGSESGNVHFNLGNAYWKAGDRGRGVLGWERARRLLPRDPDVHANLLHARSADETEDGTPLYARLLFPLATRMSSDELWLATSLTWTLLAVCMIVARLAPRGARAASRSALVAGLALAVVGASTVYRLATVEWPRHAVVVAASETPVRFEPTEAGTIHFQAPPGTVLRVLAEREGWAQVGRPDGRRGWIARPTIETL